MTINDRYCVTVSGTTNEELWREVRSQLGQTDVTSIAAVGMMNNEIADYTTWTSANGIVPFEKWLIWLIKMGTVRYGNLPENKKGDHVGHSYAPCPYSTQSTSLRTRHLLKLADTDPLPIKVDHDIAGTVYYLRTSRKSGRWGYECTCPNCTYFILNGKNYFYI